MTKQFNIRSQKAHALALDLSRTLDRPLATVVEDALAAYKRKLDDDEAELWGPKLRAVQAAFRESKDDFKIEDLYDPETGLPC